MPSWTIQLHLQVIGMGQPGTKTHTQTLQCIDWNSLGADTLKTLGSNKLAQTSECYNVCCLIPCFSRARNNLV